MKNSWRTARGGREDVRQIWCAAQHGDLLEPALRFYASDPSNSPRFKAWLKTPDGEEDDKQAVLKVFNDVIKAQGGAAKLLRKYRQFMGS